MARLLAVGSYRFRALLVVLGVAFLLLGIGGRAARAQAVWRQSVKVIAPVRTEGVIGALLDTLVSVAKRRDLKLRRSPQASVPLAVGVLQERLLEQGVSLTSANRVFISYRFVSDPHGFETTIERFYFIYRPPGGDANDIPIFTVDATRPAIQKVLRNSGMPVITNQAAIRPFYEQLLFHKLPESQLVALGGRVIRDRELAEHRRQQVLQTIRRLLY